VHQMIEELIAAPPVVTDGAWGTQLQARGLDLGEAPDGWNLSHPERVEEVADQRVRVAFLPVGDTRIELLEPTDDTSPIANHLERRGAGLHHICLRVPDIRAAMAQLSEEGYRLLSEEPLRGAHECLVCFIHPKSAGGVLIEISQKVVPDGS